MAFFEWKDRMSVGDPATDRDHQTLIGYVNEMHEAALSGYGKEMVGPMLDKMASYTREHFARERLYGRRAITATSRGIRRNMRTASKSSLNFAPGSAPAVSRSQLTSRTS
jgi:hypothetical protein